MFIDFIIISFKIFDTANVYSFYSTMQNKVLFYEIFNIVMIGFNVKESTVSFTMLRRLRT